MEATRLKLLIQLKIADSKLYPPRCPWWPPRKGCELALCSTPIHRISSAPIDFPVQISCCQLSRFWLESIGFHWFHDSLCRLEKSCELAPCCARFRRIPSTPINFIEEINYSLIRQFCVDRLEFAHISFIKSGSLPAVTASAYSISVTPWQDMSEIKVSLDTLFLPSLEITIQTKIHVLSSHAGQCKATSSADQNDSR